jgi:protein-L-isoaspartate(D-aspartate) O-methyltransferase
MAAMLVGSAVPAGAIQTVAAEEEQYREAREQLVEQIENRVGEARAYLRKSELDPRVMAAMAAVRRHEFVPDDLKFAAYENRPLPIGQGQTISQPSLVAMMTDLMDLPEHCRVLEVGTGSGYQAAVLAEFCTDVYTIEIVDELGERARQTLAEQGYDNVHVKIGDGFAGWPEHGPYDGIIVTAAADAPPPPLVDQLRPGGHLVIPLRRASGYEELVVIRRTSDGSLAERVIFPVRFVPFTRDHH